MKEDLIWVLPSDIRNYLPHKHALRGELFGRSWDVLLRPVESLAIYRKMEDLLSCLEDVRSSREYQRALRMIQASGTYAHKGFRLQSIEELDAFFQNYFGGILRSLQMDGWIISESRDYPCGLIGPDGEIIKTKNGRHRFCAAKLVSPQTPFPIRIVGMHRDYRLRFGLPFFNPRTQVWNEVLKNHPLSQTPLFKA